MSESTSNNPENGVEIILAKLIRLCSKALATKGTLKTATFLSQHLPELVPCSRIVVVDCQKNKIISTLQGKGDIDYSEFAHAIRKTCEAINSRKEAMVLNTTDKSTTPLIKKFTEANNGTQVYWLPLSLHPDDPEQLADHALWLEKWNGQTWTTNDKELLRHASVFLAHALSESTARKKNFKFSYGLAIVFALTITSFFIPVTSSTLAPLQVIPLKPEAIFSPLQGIVKDCPVEPGQHVDEGETLIQFEQSVIKQKIEESRKKIEVVLAQTAKLEGESFADPGARALLPVKKVELEKSKNELSFLESRLQQTTIKASRSGIVLFSRPENIVGSLIQTGELIMKIADPGQTKIKVMTPVKDAGLMSVHADVELQLDNRPFKTYKGKITHIGYEVVLSNEQIPSIEADVEWSKIPADIPPGVRGTAKIYGKKTSLGLQLFRRPILFLRRWTGL